MMKQILLALAVVLCAGTAQAGAINSCPSEDFDTFLKAFAKDPVVQRQNTKNPVMIGNNDFLQTMWAEQVKMPIYPDAGMIKKAGIQVTVQSPSPEQRVVIFTKKKAGLLTHYTFTKAACWQLVKVEDMGY